MNQTDMFPDQLKNSQVVKLAKRQLELTAEIESDEVKLTLKKEALKKIQETDLPNAMNELGLAKFTLDNGAQISIKPFTGATIVDKDAFFNWLESNGHGAIVKNEITMVFAKGESEKAAEAKKLIDENGFSYNEKMGVHSQTLNAFIAEQDKLDTPPVWPDETTLKIYRGQRAVIKKG